MDLSIIIVNWNTRELLAGCLGSVVGCQLPVSSYEDGCAGFAEPRPHLLAAEVIVVDNASTDGSLEMLREQFPQVRLIANDENVGFARANNQAIRESKGRYIMLLNSDTEVHPGALEAMVAFMDAHPTAAGCGPRLLNSDGSLQPSCHPMLTPEREFWRLMFLDHIWRRATYDQERWNHTQPRQVEVIKGACLLLRREALDQVGLLDDQYFMYTEEMDLCFRLLQADWELWWVPWAAVLHYGEASSKQIAEEMYIQLYRSKAQFHRKYGGERLEKRFRFLLGLAYAPRWAFVALGSLVAPSLAPRVRIYWRLLCEHTVL